MSKDFGIKDSESLGPWPERAMKFWKLAEARNLRSLDYAFAGANSDLDFPAISHWEEFFSLSWDTPRDEELIYEAALELLAERVAIGAESHRIERINLQHKRLEHISLEWDMSSEDAHIWIERNEDFIEWLKEKDILLPVIRSLADSKLTRLDKWHETFPLAEDWEIPGDGLYWSVVEFSL
jgi:hypothetical protein